MKKSKLFAFFSACLIGLLLISFQVAVYAQKHPSELRKPDPIKMTPPVAEKFEVGQGIKVNFLEDNELPLVNLSAYFKGGSLSDPGDKIGLASLMATVMRSGGTAKMSGDEIDGELSFLPAPLGVGAGEEIFSASFQCLKRHLPRVLEIFKDIVTSPAFVQEKLDLARDQWKERMKTRWDSPQTAKTLIFNELLVGYEEERMANPRTLNNISRKDLVEIHQKYFVPNNMSIVIGGDIAVSEAKKELNEVFKDWRPRKVTFLPLPKLEDKSRPKVYYAYKDIPQAHILLGHYVDITRDHPDMEKLGILSSVLGGGLSSRLSEEIRVKRGWTYGISGYVGAARANGSFRIDSALKAESLGEALTIIKNIVKGMQTELITDEELERTKDSRIYGSVFQYNNPLNIVAGQVLRKIQGRPPFDDSKRLEKIRAVTKEDVLALAKKYIHLDKLMFVIVGDKKKFDKPLEEFGEVVELSLEELKKKDLAENGKKEETKQTIKKDN